MKYSQTAAVRSFATLILALAFNANLHAAVTNVVWYRLGENDPGAVSGSVVTNLTADLIGTNHLKQFGSPRYTNAVAATAASQLRSSRSVNFNGTSQYLSNAVVSTAIDNFGLEAWVRPSATDTGNRTIVYNGSPAESGWGFIQRAGTEYRASFGTMTAFGLGTAAAGTWAHLALVRDNGMTTFYVNGVPSGTSAGIPIAATNGFMIAAHPQLLASTFFNGAVDEVRVFTFAPGQFGTNDLLLNVQRVTTTLPATSVTSTGATLSGAGNLLGLAGSAWFQWGVTTNYGNVTPLQAFGSGMNGIAFSEAISNLAGGGTYHYRAVASNVLGTVVGTNQSFTTPLFSNIGAGLTPAGFSRAAWGDYDNDGLQDILLVGATTNGSISQLWRNTGTGFSNINVYLENHFFRSVAWGDYDNDGRLDLLLGNSGLQSTELWRNAVSGFTNISGTNLGISAGPVVACGDYDNDGRLDILAGSDAVFYLLRNTGGGFTIVNVGLPSNCRPTALAWGDYDNDGRPDILFSCLPGSGNSGVLRNTGNGFSNINVNLPGLYDSSAAWGDYDADGQLDILLAGAKSQYDTNFITQVWRNTGSGFTNINAGLPGVSYGSVAWGDYDNDGRLDILLCGTNETGGPITQVWRNTGSGFTSINAGLPGVYYGSAAWGDYDNDGRLDVVLTGLDANNALVSQVWRNNFDATNSPPSAPSGLSVTVSNSVATLSWTAASDAQSSVGALTYNVRVGTSPGAADAVSAMSAASGLRRLPNRGNAENRLFATFNYTLDTPYYWSVQAVDSAFAGSAFAAERDFRVLQPPPTLVIATVSNLVSGDLNGDGIVSQSELAAVLTKLNGNGIVNQSDLDLVLANYFPNSPFLQMTNIAGLGGTNVTFALTNDLAGAFSVEYTTNFANWYPLGPATPRYLFTDTNAPAIPQRFYRLRWP